MTSRSARSIRSSSWPGARWGARGEQHLDAALPDVRLVERHLVAEGRMLDEPQPIVELDRERVRRRARARRSSVSDEVDERSGDGSMLGLAPIEQNVGTSGDRDALSDVDPAHVTDVGGTLLRGVRRPRRAGWRRAFRGPLQLVSSRAASAGLRATSPASAIPSITTTSVADGPATSNSRWMPPTRKNWIGPEVIPTDIRSTTVPPGVRSRPTRSRVRLHLPRCPCSACFVVRALEEEQDRVAAPLDQTGAVVVRRVE